MRTPKQVLLSDHKTFDIVVENGRWVMLDSNMPAQREQIIDQRIAKNLLDPIRRWEPDYGGALWSFIGKKSIFSKILERVAALLRWHRKNAGHTGNVTITEMGATLSGDDLLLSVRTVDGNAEKYVVRGAGR